MNRDRLEEIWTRHQDGQPVEPAESAELMRGWVEDPDLRGEIERDARIHDLLSATARAEQDQESFVLDVLARLDSVVPDRDREAADGDVPATRPITRVSRQGSAEAGSFGNEGAAGRLATRVSRPGSRGLRMAWGGVAAVTLVAGIVLVVAVNSRPSKSAAPGIASHSASPEMRPVLPFPAASDPGRSVDPKQTASSASELPRATVESVVPSESVVATVPVVWRAGGPRSGQLQPGLHELAQGTAKVRTPEDVELEVVAPTLIDLRDARTLDLRRGLLRVSHSPRTSPVVPPRVPAAVTSISESPLRVTTPVSELRGLEGTAEFRVHDSGETEIIARAGRLSFADRWGDVGATQPAIPSAAPSTAPLAVPLTTLSTTDYDRASLVAPWRSPPASGEPVSLTPLPIAARLTGPDSRFLGRIAVAGKTLEFGSPRTFEQARQRTFQSFQAMPARFEQQWADWIRQAAAAADRQARIEFNGHPFVTRGGDAVFGFSFSSSESSTGEGAGDSENETFQATIEIDGQVHTFHSRAEFEAARDKLFGGGGGQPRP